MRDLIDLVKAGHPQRFQNLPSEETEDHSMSPGLSFVVYRLLAFPKICEISLREKIAKVI